MAFLCLDSNCPYDLEEDGYTTTLVGFERIPGHNHDDNCFTLYFKCKDGHRAIASIRRKCDTLGCDWVGKDTCFCHKGVKVFRSALTREALTPL